MHRLTKAFSNYLSDLTMLKTSARNRSYCRPAVAVHVLSFNQSHYASQNHSVLWPCNGFSQKEMLKKKSNLQSIFLLRATSKQFFEMEDHFLSVHEKKVSIKKKIVKLKHTGKQAAHNGFGFAKERYFIFFRSTFIPKSNKDKKFKTYSSAVLSQNPCKQPFG